MWPVTCGIINVGALEHDRDQLWAEAFHPYTSGIPWHIVEDSLNKVAEAEQLERFDADVWTEDIERFVCAKDGNVSVDEVLLHLEIEPCRRTQKEKNRISAVLTSLGLKRYQQRKEQKLLWRYRRADTA